MCTKETLWFLQNLSSSDRATLILVAAFNFEKYMLTSAAFEKKVRSLSFLNHDELIRLYEHFENYRNNLEISTSRFLSKLSKYYGGHSITAAKGMIKYQLIGINLILCKISALLNHEYISSFDSIFSLLNFRSANLIDGLEHPYIFDSLPLSSGTISISEVPKETLISMGLNYIKLLMD